MMAEDDPLEPSELDLYSEPVPLDGLAAGNRPPVNSRSSYQRQTRIKLYFGCCKVFSQLRPPDHILQGKADNWRTHCPRCGRLLVIRFE